MKDEQNETVIARIKLPCAMNALVAMLNGLVAEYEGQNLFIRGEGDSYIVFKKD